MKTRTDRSVVCSQLAGKRVLITGTTGFLAKVLLEKLIRDVPDIQQFVLLIRGNKTYRSFVGLDIYCKPGIVTGNRPLNSAKPNIAFANACIEGSTML